MAELKRGGNLSASSLDTGSTGTGSIRNFSPPDKQQVKKKIGNLFGNRNWWMEMMRQKKQIWTWISFGPPPWLFPPIFHFAIFTYLFNFHPKFTSFRLHLLIFQCSPFLHFWPKIGSFHFLPCCLPLTSLIPHSFFAIPLHFAHIFDNNFAFFYLFNQSKYIKHYQHC